MLYDIHTTPLDPTPCLNPSWLRTRGRELMSHKSRHEMVCISYFHFVFQQSEHPEQTRYPGFLPGVLR